MKKRNLIALALVFVALPAFAQEAAAHGGGDMAKAVKAIGLGIAALGGTLGQARVAAAALDGTARNPAANNKLFLAMVVGLALIESLVLFAFLVANSN